MAVESAADLAGFFDTGEFAVVATVTPAGGPSREVDVIFDSDGEVEEAAETGTVTTRTSITARATDVADLKPGDAIVVEGRSFRAAAPVPHDSGLTTIPLRTLS